MIKIVKASEPIKMKKMKCLVYGQPGIGKTTYCLSAPRPLLLDVDNGISRVFPAFRQDYIPISSWDDMLEVLNSKELDIENNYETIVLDTVGKALDLLSIYLIKNNSKLGTKNGALTQQGWGALMTEFRAYLYSLNNKGLNVIFVAHDKEMTDNDKKIVRPDIPGKSASNIMREMDLVGYMQSRQNERTISFNPSDEYYGKNTCNAEPVMNVPDFNTSSVKPLTDMFTRFEQMLETQNEINQKYQKQLEWIDKVTDAVNNVDDLNSVMKQFSEKEFIWDSKVLAKIKVKTIAKDLGLTYCSDTKMYVDVQKEPETDQKEPVIDQKVCENVQKDPDPEPQPEPQPESAKKETVGLDLSPKDEARMLITEGKELVREGKMKEALALYEEAYEVSSEVYIKGMISRLKRKL